MKLIKQTKWWWWWVNWNRQCYSMPANSQRGSSVAKQKHNLDSTAHCCLGYAIWRIVLRMCVQNTHYVSANENNEKSMFERLAKDYYHLDNKWCCCYEIKCSQQSNGIECKTKIKTINKNVIHARYSCKWWNEFLLNNEESSALRVLMRQNGNKCLPSQAIRIKVSTYIQRNYNNNL